MSRWTPKDDTARRTVYARVRTEERVCWLCHQLIDLELNWPDPMSFSVDHVLPASTHQHLALERSNLHAAHLKCNRRRGAKPAARVTPRATTPRTSRDW